MAGANRNFIKTQKERKRQEKAAAKRRQRQEKKGDEGASSGPPIDFDARSEILAEGSEEEASESEG